MKRTKIAEGIWKDAKGLSGIVKARGIQRERRFPPATSLRTIEDWRQRERVRLKDAKPRGGRGSLASDIDRYLDTLGDRPALKKERTRQLEWWRERFGTRRREDLDAAMIQTALVELHETKAASTCNHYRLALAHLWSTLDGKDARNPLRNVPTFVEPEAEARNLPDALVTRLFAAMPDVGQTRKGKKRPMRSLTKIRLRVMVETGFSPAEIKRLQPGDLALDEGAVYVRRRLKGKGSEGVLMPLTAAGVSALRAFLTADAFGPFQKRVMYSAWVRACKRVLKSEDLTDAQRRLLKTARPYDLRHTFGTRALQLTQDLRMTQELMRHRSAKTTKRYTRAAMSAHLQEAVARLAGKPADPENGKDKQETLRHFSHDSDRVH